MKLEEAIKQKTPFKSQRQKAAVNLIYTHNWLVGKQKDHFQPFGITLRQYNVLRILRGQNLRPISTSDIRDRMLDKMSDVSRIVDRLVKKELVVRKTCKTDKRLVDVIISDGGLSLLEDIDKAEIAFDEFFSNLNNQEIDKLNELLDKLRDS